MRRFAGRLDDADTAGVARRADRSGPVVGTALEGLDRGRGSILMLVHRGWVAAARAGRLAAIEARLEERLAPDHVAARR